MKGIILEMKELTDSREVMESKENPKMSTFLYIIVSLLVVSIIFSCVLEIDEYVKLNGEIKTKNISSSVMATSTCKINEINIEEGQYVNKGDVLFVLDTGYAEEQKNIIETSLQELKIRKENIEILKKSVLEDKNYFSENENSDFFYRYEQYKNAVKSKTNEIGNSKINTDLSKKETENLLNEINEKIKSFQIEHDEYIILKNSIINNDIVYPENNGYSLYLEYKSKYDKLQLTYEQYKEEYTTLEKKYNDYISNENDIQSIRLDYINQINLNIEKITENSENSSLISEYRKLVDCINNDQEYTGDELEVIKIYLDYKNKYNEKKQFNLDVINEQDLKIAKFNIENSSLDIESLKSVYISQIDGAINKLNENIEDMKSSKENYSYKLQALKDTSTYSDLTLETSKIDMLVSLNQEIAGIENNVLSYESQYKEYENIVKNAFILATCSGEATFVGKYNVGDIVTSGSNMCTIIPMESDLEAILYIPDSEIAKLKVGQKTEYIINSIPYNEYGKLTGEIISISADAISNKEMAVKYYLATANLSNTSLKNKNNNIRSLKSGMLLEAKSVTGKSKVIKWLLRKINLLD
jgi:membrane fusion protein, peptide pheromone/bacteriocin exporter